MKQFIWLSCLFLCACSKDDDASLINKWQLESYVKDYGSLVINVPTPVFFSFNKENILNIELEKNTCEGEFLKDGKSLSFSSFTCDTLCCDSTYSINGYNLLLDSINSHTIDGRVLKLKGNSDGVMHFKLID